MIFVLKEKVLNISYTKNLPERSIMIMGFFRKKFSVRHVTFHLRNYLIRLEAKERAAFFPRQFVQECHLVRKTRKMRSEKGHECKLYFSPSFPFSNMRAHIWSASSQFFSSR